MLALALCVLWITVAACDEIPSCPINEAELFKDIEKAPVPETRFELYTQYNRDIYQPLTDEVSIRQSYYNASRRTVIAVHGYNGNPKSLYLLKSAYLRFKDCNFIIVNWSVGASEANYALLSRNLASVAKYVADGLELLKMLTGCKFADVHLIGWSLGGQLVGFVGKYVRSEKIGRITALDPAGICFSEWSPEHRLHLTDASFVDVIITTGGSLILNVPTGHLNFAPDGGKMARDCGHINTGQAPIDANLLNGCSHVRAVELFTASLSQSSKCLPVGYACSDYDTYEKGECFSCGTDGRKCAVMGIHADKFPSKTINETVMLYLDTTFTGDFCLFQYHVEIEISNTSNSGPEVGVMYLYINKGQDDEIEILLQPSANKVRRPELLIPGRKYTYLARSDTKIQSVMTKTLHFFWVSYRSTEYRKLFIRRVTIIPMNNYFAFDKQDDTICATGKTEGIPPEMLTHFQIISSC